MVEYTCILLLGLKGLLPVPSPVECDTTQSVDFKTLMFVMAMRMYPMERKQVE